MIAAFITVYAIGFIGMAGFILFALGVSAMLGSFPTNKIWKAFALATIWPILIVWGFINWIIHKIRN